jgi:hypothetical protein
VRNALIDSDHSLQIARVEVKLAKPHTPTRERPKAYWEPTEEEKRGCNQQIMELWREKGPTEDPMETFVGVLKKAAQLTPTEKPTGHK